MPNTGARPFKCTLGCKATFSTQAKQQEHVKSGKCPMVGQKKKFTKRPGDDD